MAFYHLLQNNSGGGFDFDEATGITHHVVIEADSAEEATERAEGIGCYWNGVAKGEDCDCCGDRWHEPCGYDAREFPHIFGEPLGTATRNSKWMKDGRETAVHYKDGRIEWYNADNTRASE